MIFHTGPTKSALVLLCCVGTWLAVCSLPFDEPTADMITTILGHLKHNSKELYENYHKDSGHEMKIDESLQLPCFTLGCEASANISTIQAYLEKVQTLDENRTNTANVIKRLDDIKCSNITCPNPPKPSISGTKPSISGTEKPYIKKEFILTVLKRFSDCMAGLKAKDKIC